MSAMAAFNTRNFKFREFSKKCNNVMDEWNKFTDFLYGQRIVGIKKSIMSYFHKSFGKNMLQEPSDKFHGRKFHGFPFFLFAVFVQEFNDIIFNAFDAIIRDGDPEYISWKIS